MNNSFEELFEKVAALEDADWNNIDFDGEESKDICTVVLAVAVSIMIENQTLKLTDGFEYNDSDDWDELMDHLVGPASEAVDVIYHKMVEE